MGDLGPNETRVEVAGLSGGEFHSGRSRLLAGLLDHVRRLVDARLDDLTPTPEKIAKERAHRRRGELVVNGKVVEGADDASWYDDARFVEDRAHLLVNLRKLVELEEWLGRQVGATESVERTALARLVEALDRKEQVDGSHSPELYAVLAVARAVLRDPSAFRMGVRP